MPELVSIDIFHFDFAWLRCHLAFNLSTLCKRLLAWPASTNCATFTTCCDRELVATGEAPAS